jgi:hypothetical protein
MKVKIYALYEPHTCKIRYIGRTRSSLNKRLSQHISKARNNYNNSHKENWIRKLLKNGIRPKIRLLEIVDGWLESHKREKHLIQEHFNSHNLVNADDRGPGNCNKNNTVKRENLRIKKIKEYYSKEENKSQFYNKLYCYNLFGKLHKEYKSVAFASKELGISKSRISNQMSRFDNYGMKINPIKNYFFSKKRYKVFPLNYDMAKQSNHTRVKIFNGYQTIIYRSLESFKRNYNLSKWDMSQYRKGILTKKMKGLTSQIIISPL